MAKEAKFRPELDSLVVQHKDCCGSDTSTQSKNSVRPELQPSPSWNSAPIGAVLS